MGRSHTAFVRIGLFAYGPQWGPAACCAYRVTMSDVGAVRSDRCGLDELFLAYEVGEAEHVRLELGPDWLRRWTTTWRVLGVRLLSIPGEPRAYTDLVDGVPASSAAASPPMTPDHARPPGRLVTIASRATTGVHGAVSSVNGVVTIAIIVIVWALFVLHKLAILSAVSSTP